MFLKGMVFMIEIEFFVETVGTVSLWLWTRLFCESYGTAKLSSVV